MLSRCSLLIGNCFSSCTTTSKLSVQFSEQLPFMKGQILSISKVCNFPLIGRSRTKLGRSGYIFLVVDLVFEHVARGCEGLGAQSPRWRPGLSTQGPSGGKTKTVERAVVVYAGLTLM